MSLFRSLVIQLLNTLMNDSRVLELVLENSKRWTWMRMKHSRTALDTILSRWREKTAVEGLIEEVLQLNTPAQWEQWIQLSEESGVRLDIWKAYRAGSTEISQSDLLLLRSGILGLWFGEDKAESIPWRVLFPGHG